ncbi:hypothetical protein Tco_1368927 [Tanacetum coccineum]
MVAYLEKTDGNTEFHQIMDRTKHIEIRFHFIRDCYEKRLIEVIKIHTDYNVADLLTKGLDATVAGKPVTITKASIRSDLLFDDANGVQTGPSPIPSPSIAIHDSNLGGSGGNHGAQAKEIKALKAQGRKSVKSSKGEPSMYKDPAFDDLDDDAMDYIETKDAQDGGRTSSVVLEEKESADKEVSTEAPVSTVKPNEGTNKRNEGTDKQDGGTDSTKVSTDRQGEGIADHNEGKSATQTAPTTTSTPTPTIFGDDETIAQVLITMSQNKQKEKDKGVEIRNVEDTERPRPTSTRSVLTLKPFPKIDPKDKGKKMIDEEGESDTESDDITEAEKKFKMLAKDEEVARKVQEEWETEEEKKRLAKEEATKEEREKFTIEQRAKFLHDTIVSQRKFLAQQRSVEDERQIIELNKDLKKKRVIKETPRKEDTVKVPAEQEVTEQGTKKRKSGHVKMIARKRPRPQPDDDSDDEHIKCLRIVTFDSTIDSEIMEIKSFIARLHKISSPDRNYLVVYRVNGHFRAFNYLMKQYSKITPEDIELILWRDLKIMMESSTEENDQELKDGTFIYMLVKRRYPLSKELLQQMLDLGLEVEEESTAALQLGSQFTLLHSKELASPGSNSSCAPCYGNEALTSPKANGFW